MIDLTDEQKALFYTGGNFKDYVFYFPDLDLSITNETIHQEAVTIKESICEEEEFALGGCIASSIEFEVSEIIQYDLTGLEFTATLYVNLRDNGTYDLKLPMGVYRVDSAKMVDDKDYKKVVAYDALYDASIDASDWYNRLLPNDNSTTTAKQMRESLLIYLDIPFAHQNLTNDNMVITKTVRAELGSLPGMMVLKNLCEIAGGFGRMGRDGKFEVCNLGALGLFPEDAMGVSGNVYPEETLYPEDRFQYISVSDETTSHPEYRTTHYEEYWTEPITCLTIQTDEEDFGVTIGEDTSNPYLLIGNFLLWGKNLQEITQIGQGIFKQIKGMYYRPSTTELDGLPYLQTGDTFALEKRNDDVECYILSRTLSGVQGLKDTYEAKGSQVRANEVSKSSELIQLKGKTLKLKKSIDGVSAELSDLEAGTNSKFEMTNQKIETEVTRATQAEGTLNAKVTQTSERITSEVTRATQAEGNLNSKIDQTANSINLNVSQNYATKNELSASVTILDNKISLKVTAGDVQSLIEQNADSIRLKADKISWSSTYSSMSESGILKCSSAEVKGTFKCGSDSGYWLFLNTNGEMAGGYGGSQYGKINFAAKTTNVDNGQVYNGIQMTGGTVRISTNLLSTRKTTDESQLAYIGATGELKVITNIWYEGSTMHWQATGYKFENGLLVSQP